MPPKSLQAWRQSIFREPDAGPAETVMGVGALIMLALHLYYLLFEGVTPVSLLLCPGFVLSAIPGFLPTESGLIAGFLRITAIVYWLGVVVYFLLFF